MYLALSGKARSGKDTVAEYLNQKYNFHIIRFAQPVYDIVTYIQHTLGKPAEKDPQMLQFIGNGLKSVYGDDVWCNKLLKELYILKDKSVVICDVRHKVEANILTQMNIPIIRVNKTDRLIDRDPTHISEIDLDDYDFEYVIDNNGTLDELYANVDKIMLTFT
jgi:dephospho-CoA kinase